MSTTEKSHQDQPPQNNHNPTPNMDDDQEKDIDDFETEDILSLCDLPVNSCSNNNTATINKNEEDSNSMEVHQNSSSAAPQQSVEDQDNFFEFFSEEWNIKTTTPTPTITHCKSSPCLLANGENIKPLGGKVLSKQRSEVTDSHFKSKNFSQQKRNNSLVPWRYSNPSYSKSNKDSKSGGGDKHEGSEAKVSVFSFPMKSKLLLVLFGVPPKIPTDQTELMSDIKIRQSRRSPSTFMPAEGGGCSDTGDGGGGQGMVPVGGRKRDHALWRFIRAVTCFGGQRKENDVV